MLAVNDISQSSTQMYDDLTDLLNCVHSMHQDGSTVQLLQNSSQFLRSKLSIAEVDLLPQVDEITHASHYHLTPIVLSEIKQEEFYLMVQNKDTLFPYTLCLPIISEQQLLAVLCLHYRQKPELTPHQAHLLKMFQAHFTQALRCKYVGLFVQSLSKIQTETLQKTVVGELVNGIIHDVNNPLQIATGNIQLVEMTHNYEKVFPKIKKQLGRIVEILSNFSLFTLDKHNGNYQEQIDLSQHLEQTIKAVEYVSRKNQVTFENKVRKNSPLILGNSNLYHQLFINFFTYIISKVNAPTIISLTSFLEGHILHIKCCVNALILIPELKTIHLANNETIQVSLYEKDYRFMKCDEILKRYNGHISVENQNEEETTYTFSIPICTEVKQ